MVEWLSMRKHHRTKALLAGILAGICAPASIGAAAEYPRPRGSDLDRLRGDVDRIGRDFKTVISREHGKAKHSEQTAG